MSKKLAKIIAARTGASVWASLMFIRGELGLHAARMNGPVHQRAQARSKLSEARFAWANGVPLALPSVGRHDRYYVPVEFFVRSGVPLARMSASQMADDCRRQLDRFGCSLEAMEVVEG